MKILSNLEFINIVDELLASALLVDSFFYNTIEFLYYTGSRFSELDLSLWSKISDDVYKLTSLKKSNIRIFNKNELPDMFLVSFEMNDLSAFITSYSTFIYYFHKLTCSYTFFLEGKYLLSHCFRHRLAKLKYIESNSTTYVQNYLGEKTMESALGYIFSKITLI
jgi:hypothetical protein